MYMQKKVYVVPNLEVIETEPESMMVNTSPGGTTNFGPGDFGGEEDENAGMATKDRYGFNSVPWE